MECRSERVLDQPWRNYENKQNKRELFTRNLACLLSKVDGQLVCANCCKFCIEQEKEIVTRILEYTESSIWFKTFRGPWNADLTDEYILTKDDVGETILLFSNFVGMQVMIKSVLTKAGLKLSRRTE